MVVPFGDSHDLSVAQFEKDSLTKQLGEAQASLKKRQRRK